MRLGKITNRAVLKYWIILAVFSAMLCLVVYGTAQQILRTSANDPQIQMAEDFSQALEGGKEPGSLVPIDTVSIDASLSPFVVIYSDDGSVIAGNGLLGGEVPSLPGGVLEYTKSHLENRVTWAPISNVRIASVVRRYSGKATGYVLVGRNLREVEKRTKTLLIEITAGWVTTNIATLGVLLVVSPINKKT